MSRRKNRIPSSLASAAAAIVALLAPPVLAAVSIWDGGGGSDWNWSTAANWAGDVIPPSTNDVQFANGFGSSPEVRLNGNRTANSMIINTLTEFTLAGFSGQVLTLTSGNVTRNDIPGVEGDVHIGLSTEIAMGADGVWNIAGSGSLDDQGPISGGHHLTKTGNGTLKIGGSVNAALFVNAGILEISGFGNNVTVASGGTLDLNTAGLFAAVALNGNGVGGTAGAMRNLIDTGMAFPVTIQSNSTINAQGGLLRIMGGITDGANTFGITKIGLNELRLESASSYDGTTTVNAGTLGLYNNNALGAGNAIIASGATISVAPSMNINHAVTISGLGVGSGGTLIGDNATWSGPITLAANASIGSSAGPFTITGSITDGASTFNLTKTGSGDVIFASANSYNGSTTVAGGRLIVQSVASISNSSSINVQSGAALGISGGLSFGNSLSLAGNGPTGAGALHSVSGSNTWTGPISASSPFSIGNEELLTITGAISAPGVAMTKVGAGPLSLRNAANSFGDLIIAQGTLSMAGEAGLPAGSTIIIAAGSQAFISFNTVNRALNLSGNGFGDGALRSDLTAAWAGPITLAADSTIFAGGALTISGNISGAGRTLIKNGAGTLILTGANSHAVTNVAQGTLSVQSSSAIPASSTTNVVAGAALILGNSATLPASATLHISGSGISDSGALRGTNGANTWAGTIVLEGNTTVSIASGAQVILAGTVNETAPFTLTKNGPGTLTLGAANNYSGGTIINDGTLNAADDVSLGAEEAPVTINGGKLIYTGDADTSRNFTLINGRLQASGNLSLSGSRINGGFLAGPGTFRTDSSTSLAGVTTFAGANISATGNTSLTSFINGGNLQSAAPVAWDGGINLSSGIVTVQSNVLNTTALTNDGAININSTATLLNTATTLVSGGGSRITINSGGTLNVSATSLDLNGALLVNNGTIVGTTNVNFGSLAKGAGVYGAVNVGDGGRFSPGNSPGSVVTGSTIWNSGGSYLVELDNAAGDFWNVDGQLEINASPQHPFTISLASLDGLIFDSSQDHSWPILHAAGGIIELDPGQLALDTSNFKNDLGAGHFFLSASATDLTVNFSAVPEPAALWGFMVVLCTACKRRQK